MADDRLPCRDNYTDLETQLQALTAQITAMYQLLADLGLVSLTPISQDDYDSLTPSEQLAGCFDIYNAPNLKIDGDSVSYDSNTSIKQRVYKTVKKTTFTQTTTSGGACYFPDGIDYRNVLNVVSISRINTFCLIRGTDQYFFCFNFNNGVWSLIPNQEITFSVLYTDI